ncbi:glycosyltransferase [Vibrio sp.]|uniref:glycosyltransferase n=1 Tax=Vibrio sp. TaxID=678 RepID=UPI003AA94E9B
MKGLVTVYIPTHNRVDLLKRAVESVLNQTYKKIELIVVDDNSTDKTWDYLKSLQSTDKRVKVFKNSENKGACFSRNLAILQSSGYYITGLDDDDYFNKNRIENFYKNRNKLDNYSFLSSAVNKISLDGKQLGTGFDDFCIISNLDLSFGNKIGNQIFTKKEIYIDAGLFDEELNCWQDYDLWIRITNKFGPSFKLNHADYYLDVDPNRNRITTSTKKIESLKYFLKKHEFSLHHIFKARYSAFIYVNGNNNNIFNKNDFFGKCYFLFFIFLYKVKYACSSRK